MSQGAILDHDSRQSILRWAVEKQADITASLLKDGLWRNLRSRFHRFDPDQRLIQITYPVVSGHGAPAEIIAGQTLGISFRRGHKKCIFVSPVVMRRTDVTDTGDSIDTLLVRAPDRMRELQRRAYQRVHVPPGLFIAVKLWQGGVPSRIEVSWPLCAGRVGNISVGGLLVDIRAEQNPQLRVGDLVGVEITIRPGCPPLLAEAQYRHTAATGSDRLGLGFQFVGLEHDVPGRTSITDVADFVKELRRQVTRHHQP